MNLALHGGFGEKGRTCFGVASGGYRLLVDAGVKTSARGRADYYPALAASELAAYDGLVVTHAHEDHVAALAWCVVHGFRGDIYMTGETRREADAILAEYAEPAHVEALRARSIVPLAVGERVLQLGPFSVSTGRSGHIRGGVWCRFDDGARSLVYCSDVAPASPVFAMDAIGAADVLIVDASYGDDATPPQARAAEIAAWVNAHPQGCVLPTPAQGRSAELLAIVPGPLALAPGMREALAAQIADAAWLAPGVAGTLRKRLDAAVDWSLASPLPPAALLCHDAMGVAGTSPAILERAGATAHPTLFTGHLPHGTPGERMLAERRADWIRLPTHPTLSENVAMTVAARASLVIGHSCDTQQLIRLAPHIPALRPAMTGERIAIGG